MLSDCRNAVRMLQRFSDAVAFGRKLPRLLPAQGFWLSQLPTTHGDLI